MIFIHFKTVFYDTLLFSTMTSLSRCIFALENEELPSGRQLSFIIY